MGEEAPEETSDRVGGNWEFIDRVPTTEDVSDLLATLPPVWGVRTLEFAEYVQALPQKKKIDRPRDDGRGTYVDTLQTYSLYMSVGGRIKMIERAAEMHGWRVEFEPEPVTPTGVPGMLQMDDRIVYREYVSIWTPIGLRRMVADQEQTDGQGTLTVAEYQPLGRKPGVAWVPSSGGRQAAGSNPYEKVETSARGRAIAAWGFGVLPGSGVASLEEMLGVDQNERAMRQGDQMAAASGKSKEELVADALTLAEQVRQSRGIEPDDMAVRVGQFFAERLGIQSVYDEEEKAIDWAKVKPGQVVLFIQSLQETLRKLSNEEPGL